MIASYKKMLVQLIKIGVQYSDQAILDLASTLFDSNDVNYAFNKKAFLNDIHRISGK